MISISKANFKENIYLTAYAIKELSNIHSQIVKNLNTNIALATELPSQWTSVI